MDVQSVINNVTERVKDTANVRVVFGDPIETRDVTLIPVACIKVAGGVGGGKKHATGGDASANPDRGMGLGMHVATTPIGYIEIRDGEATMVDIVDKNKIALGGMILGGAVLLTFAKVLAWKLKQR